MGLLGAVWKLLTDWMDPVCQDVDAVMYEEHDGCGVRLVPVVDNGRVTKWIPDPRELAEMERLRASPAYVAPQPSATPALPPPLPGGASAPFNPAGVPGI